MRQATYNDVARLAYLILVWDKELPEFLQMIRGDANAAFQAAQLMLGPKFVTWVVGEEDFVGAISINRAVSLFGFHSYGLVVGVFVLPKYRGGKLLGLRLIQKAVELKTEMNWRWLEMQPWADDRNTRRVLERLGFSEALHTFVLR